MCLHLHVSKITKFKAVLSKLLNADNVLTVDSQEGTTNETDLGLDDLASIILPQSTTDALNHTDVIVAFIVYEESTLFPIRNQNNTENNTESTIVGSAIVSANVLGILTGTQLSNNVTIKFVLKNTENYSNEVRSI